MKSIVFGSAEALSAAVKEADDFLYMDKRQRRDSVCKAAAVQRAAADDDVAANETNQLTGLYFSQSFFRKVDSFVKQTDPSQYCLAAIDIKNFWLFNKWYTRKEGDRLLTEIGRMLRDVQNRCGGVAGYLGGDNFAILLPDDRALIEAVQADIQRVIRLLGKSYGFLPVVGVYHLSRKVLPAINMFDCAVIAQNTITDKSRTFIHDFDISMAEVREKEMVIISEMKEALDRKEFVFFLQPQYDIEQNRIVGAEALVRWNHPQRGLIVPG